MGVGGQLHAPATLPPGKTPIPTAQEAGESPGKVCTSAENLTPPPPWFDPQTLQPVVNCYTDYTIPRQNILYIYKMKKG
jgi:hypothetical protein